MIYTILSRQFQTRPIGESEDPDVRGRCDSDEDIIYLREGMTMALRRDTVLHEIIHAIDEILGLKLSERQVRALGAALATISELHVDLPKGGRI